jgi:hypothetical protein
MIAVVGPLVVDPRKRGRPGLIYTVLNVCFVNHPVDHPVFFFLHDLVVLISNKNFGIYLADTQLFDQPLFSYYHGHAWVL